MALQNDHTSKMDKMLLVLFYKVLVHFHTVLYTIHWYTKRGRG